MITKNKQFLNAGFGNMVNIDKIDVICEVNSAPIKRLININRENGNCIEINKGKKAQSVIILSNDRMIISSVLAKTLAARYDDVKKE